MSLMVCLLRVLRVRGVDPRGVPDRRGSANVDALVATLAIAGLTAVANG
jgi:hypothetical protein